MARFDAGLRFDSGVRLDSGDPTNRRTKMIEIRKSWTKLPIGERVVFMGNVIANQEKTPKILAHDDPKLADFKAKYLLAKAKDDQVTELETALKAARMARTATVDDALAAMAPNASFVEATAETEAQVVEIGFEPAKTTPAPSQPMTQVTELTVTPGDNDGELDWTLHPLPGANGYEGRTTTDPNDATKWKMHQVAPRSSGTLTGLPSGVRHYAQFRALGPLGPGPWSDLAWRMVP